MWPSRMSPWLAASCWDATRTLRPLKGVSTTVMWIGKLNFLEPSTRGDNTYATHMCARFANDPKVEHGKAVKWAWMLSGRQSRQGSYHEGGSHQGVGEVYPDADFAGAWEPEGAGEDVDTARSRHSFVITYAGCPLVWKTKCRARLHFPALKVNS